MKDNKTIAKEWLTELWGKGDLSKADELMSENYKRNDRFRPVQGIEEYKKYVEHYRNAIDSLEITLEHIISENSLVFMLWVAKGNLKVELDGISPTENLSIRGLDLLRIEDGKIVESWPSFDAMDARNKNA